MSDCRIINGWIRRIEISNIPKLPTINEKQFFLFHSLLLTLVANKIITKNELNKKRIINKIAPIIYKRNFIAQIV